MSAVSRVSAFAKRRRLNDDSVVRASESDGSSTTSSVKEAKPRKIAAQQSHVSKGFRHTLSCDEVSSVGGTNGTNGASENTFEPLVDAKAVSFIGTREIEQINENTCKIRLSRGQKCSLHGIARLWVREGSVYVYGALLNESPNIYTVFLSEPGSFAHIVARSKVAEFQLESLQSTGDPFPSTANIPGKLGEAARDGVISFRVLGPEQDGHTSSLDTVSDIDVQIQKILPRFRSGTNDRAVAPRILCCGKRSADTYRASISLVNHLLTDSLDKLTVSASKGVAFLDLDFAAPAFSAPGTISIAILQRPVLGPSYTWPLQQHSKWPDRILTVQYIGAVGTSETPKIDLNCINELLSTAKEVVNNKSLIIRTGTWLAHMKQSDRAQLRKLLGTNLIVCFDAHKTSPHYEAAQNLSEGFPDTLFHLPMSPCVTSSLSEHKLLLQSHFRLCNSVESIPLWYQDPIPDADNRRLVLSTDDSKNEIRFLQVRGGMLRPQDIPNAILQNLVVIVAIPTTKGPEHSTSTHHNPEDFEQNLSGERVGTRALLEFREVDEAQILHYVGLAYVEEVDVQTKLITLNTTVGMDDLRQHTSAGHEIGIVLEKVGMDGRFGRSLLFR